MICSLQRCFPWFGAVTSVEEVVVWQGHAVKVVVPARPLAPGAVQVQLASSDGDFSVWNEEAHQEAFTQIQKVIAVWQAQGITNYMVYGKSVGGTPFAWEVVPYPSTGWAMWRQLKVVWNLIFGSFSVPAPERYRIADELRSCTPKRPVDRVSGRRDFFCEADVITRQCVFEGKTIRVLYDYAPLGENRLHFLLVPKRHCVAFSDLTEEEYMESRALAQRLIRRYEGTAHVFDKTGERAGQSVPHWHEHVVFTANRMQTFLGKLAILQRMLIGSSPLAAADFQARADVFRQELSA